MNRLSLDFASLGAAYDAGLHPEAVMAEVYRRIRARGQDHVWIHLVPEAEAAACARQLAARRAAGAKLPLYGLPFAVKDNIDVAGLPTTAACPEFSYVAGHTAHTVQRLLDAGAILVGKANLDQFATGLVGVRSPYGAPSSVFNPAYISGGSSSGSSVAVAAGLVSFSLGTDTAGSGRVPAAFNNLVGWKPTRGLVSTDGVVPACRSLDCISFFTLTCEDSRTLIELVSGYDASDAYSRPRPATLPALPTETFRFGVPARHQLEFFGDTVAAEVFAQAVVRLESLGGRAVEIDFTPFRETAELLYAGPWVAERLAAIEPFYNQHPDAVHPVTASIIGGGARYSALDTFRAFYRLEALRQQTREAWTAMDVLLLPTAGTIYTHEQVAREPVQLNTNLGLYTNFVNLLDLCGVAVPAGFRPDGLPFGITLLAPAFTDDAVCAIGARFHRSLGGILGGTTVTLDSIPRVSAPASRSGAASAPGPVHLAVVGAHLTGQPLNHQLTTRRATLVKKSRTASGYRLYALRGTVPPKPGLVRSPSDNGGSIELEVWSLDQAAFGSFVAEVPPPLAIGSVELEDGSTVKGFVCEPFALGNAEEITRFGGWRAYLGNLSASKAVAPPHVTSAR